VLSIWELCHPRCVCENKPVLLRQPEDGQFGPKHVVVCLSIKYTYVTGLCLTIHNFQGCFVVCCKFRGIYNTVHEKIASYSGHRLRCSSETS